MAVFLDSSLNGSLGRYSVIGLQPYLVVKEIDGMTYETRMIRKRDRKKTVEDFIKTETILEDFIKAETVLEDSFESAVKKHCLKENVHAMDVIEAVFPGGSITGAPKIRAMEIIDELEHDRRGIYTGCIGYIAFDGSCDLNIVIRTALYQNGTYYLGVGGGITCESESEFEYEETLQKAKAVLEAITENKK